MKERVFLKTKEVTIMLSKSLFFLLVIASIVLGCKKTKSYEPIIPYNTTIDTATLKIKVINPPLASGVDVTEPTTKVILFLFDAKNLFLSQAAYNGIRTEDTSIVLNGLPMGHYTAFLVVDGPGITNLNYLTKGVQSYQEVVDTLQSLLTGTYVGTYQDINYVGLSQTLLVNQKYNEGILNMQPLYSIISQITFDLSQIYTAWQKVPQLTDGLNLLVFQNGGFVRQIPVKDEDIAKKSFSVPIAQGANYSFLFTDLTNQPKVCKLADSLIKGVSTIADVETLAERYNNNIRMGVGVLEATTAKTLNSLPQATTTNLTKTIYNGLVENAMAETIFTIDPAQNIPTTKPSNSDGLTFLEFQDGKLIRIMPINDAEFATGAVTTQILKGEKYDFLFVDLLKEDGQFLLHDTITTIPSVSINQIQSRVEPYNNKGNAGIMRMAAPGANNTLDRNKSLPVINGLATVTFNLASLKSKSNTNGANTDGFALLEFKDGVLIKKTDIPYEDDAIKSIPAEYTTSVVKSTKYSFWFVDLAKSSAAVGTPFQLKNEITKNGKLVGNISIADVKNMVEPYLNQNMRMGTIAEGDLTTATANLSVVSLIQQVKLNFTGAPTCNDWSTSPNWSVLILDQSGYYKRTAIRNVTSYSDLSTTPFNIFTDSKYYIAAVGGLGTDISKVELPTTNYNTLATINTKYPVVQPNLYSWVAIDSCLPGQTTYESHASTGTITITATPTNSPIKTLTQVDRITLQTIPQLRALSASTNFSCYPIRITGIVTSDSSGENDIKNLIILQDASAINNAAIPIQFKTDPKLKKGDKVTIAIQDGDLTRNNAAAPNMLVLQNVTYTPDPSNPIIHNQPMPTIQPLGNITYSNANLAPANMAKYEAMLVSFDNVEFRYWANGQTFYDLIHLNGTADTIQLRDAANKTTLANTAPSARAFFRLKMNTSLTQFGTFGKAKIPAGIGSVRGILTMKNATQYAVQPRDSNDVKQHATLYPNGVTNVMADRVDKGFILKWNYGAPDNNTGGVTENKANPNIMKTNTGVAFSGATLQAGAVASYSNYNYFYLSSAAPGQGIFTNNFVNATDTNAYILMTLSTQELVNQENIQISLNGVRGTPGIGAQNMTFKVEYSLNNTAPWVQVSGSSFAINQAAASTTPFNLPATQIDNIGGYPLVYIRIKHMSGKSSGGINVDNYISWYNITLTQIP